MPNVVELEKKLEKEMNEKLYVERLEGLDEVLLDRTSFMKEWDTEAYLKDFYTKVEDPAMVMVLTYLPTIVARLGPVQRVLDFGAGPTIHVAVCFRNTASEIYLADYLPQNLEWLENWRQGKTNFDWEVPLRMIACQEGTDFTLFSGMQAVANKKVAGVYFCDCFKSPSVDAPADIQGNFDVITTIFTVEYCCNTYEEYRTAIKNIVDQIRPGGHLIMGGILEETWCSFGGRKFTCLYISQEFMLEALRDSGLLVDDAKACTYYEVNGMFMIVAKKAGGN